MVEEGRVDCTTMQVMVVVEEHWTTGYHGHHGMATMAWQPWYGHYGMATMAWPSCQGHHGMATVTIATVLLVV